MTAAVTANKPPGAIDPKLIVPVVESVKNVFKMMVNLDVTTGKVHLKPTPVPTHDVSGIIGLSGDVTGSIVVSFPFETASKIVAAFAGGTFESTSPEFSDAIGELANMIAGGAKKAFGVQASITVPSVIVGGRHVIAGLTDIPCVVIPCGTNLGSFAVEVCIKKNT